MYLAKVNTVSNLCKQFSPCLIMLQLADTFNFFYSPGTFSRKGDSQEQFLGCVLKGEKIGKFLVLMPFLWYT